MKLNPHQLRVVAARACCDPRSVKTRLRKGKQSSTMSARIDEALRDCGFVEPETAQAGAMVVGKVTTSDPNVKLTLHREDGAELRPGDMILPSDRIFAISEVK